VFVQVKALLLENNKPRQGRMKVAGRYCGEGET